MNTIFPFEKLDDYELAIKEVCNRYRWYLERKLPRNFNKWFVMKDYQNEQFSYNHLVNCPERNYSDTMLKRKNNINIVINLLPLCTTHVPSPNTKFDYSKYDGKQEVEPWDYESIQEKFPYMLTKDGKIKFSIDVSYAIYICTHEWFHTMTYVDWDNPYSNTDYLWFMELHNDVRALNFLRQNVNEINELFSDLYSDEEQFQFEMQYIEEISRAANSYIRSKIPPCIFE